MIIDLHIHSGFSDGELSLKEILSEIIKNKVKIFSVTDHNTLKYGDEFFKIAQEKSITLIEGIEISTIYRKSDVPLSIHVLGYAKKFDSDLLKKELSETVDKYNERAKKIINKLNTQFSGLNMNFDLIYKNTQEVYVSRNTIAKLLVEYLKNISIKDALKQYVFIEEDDSWMMETFDAFSLIKKAGGVPVLAHSGRELRRLGVDFYEKMIKEFVQTGLQGLEVYHPKHTQEEINIIRNIAKKYGLFITGGSDWHGLSNSITNEKIGINMSETEVNNFLLKLEN